ncbi:hypothetical protein LUZ61_017146 [Rhynchospora tenuis]|uniref:KIB1-4 beta-propeller domain-containing protein n=1 Tax=Rhynchospora tenuis TaxID=198213 RepID=A0AAD5Z6U2_9POAL|nr:hypothetical protein LUZ61_017146 [Rhynchospora tenuis]
MGKKDSPSSVFRDWAHLPPEIVELISDRVKSVTDYVRFRVVCSPWHSASLPKPRHHLSAQLPWLMLPYSWTDLSSVSFDDVFESKTHRFHLPVPRGRDISGTELCGSYRGWLLLSKHLGEEVILLNPLTRALIQLPPFIAPARDLGGDDWDVPLYDIIFEHPGNEGFFFPTKVTFSTDLTDPNCLITVFIEPYWVICCQIGDPCWTRVDIHLQHLRHWADVTYYDGLFYFLPYSDEGMPIIDSKDTEERIVHVPELSGARKFFVEGKSGVYVLAIHPEEKFELYQFLEKPMKLEQITDTSDRTAIFYGDDYPCLAVSTADCDSLDGDSVYIERKSGPYTWKCAWKCAVGSHCNIYSSQLEHEVLESFKERPRLSGEQLMWFQPSFF